MNYRSKLSEFQVQEAVMTHIWANRGREVYFCLQIGFYFYINREKPALACRQISQMTLS